MLKLALAVALVWLALMPPLFTDGACTREFEAEFRRVDADRQALPTLSAARIYWQSRGVEHRVLTLEQCRRARLEFIEQCGPGPMIYATVPVANPVCRVYRDGTIKVQMHFTDRERLARVNVDMAPYRSLPVPYTQHTLHWAR